MPTRPPPLRFNMPVRLEVEMLPLAVT